jgi:hypothetical protein
MRVFYLLLLTLCITGSALAQKGAVKGNLYDSLAKQPVGSATITLLKKKDSSLVSFTMTDNKGFFELTGLADGDYRLMVTHVNYHNSNRLFSINEQNRSKDLGTISMKDLAQVLEEVVVSAEAPPVTLVGDTIQYNAGSFKVQPNANVEDLLKRLPGIKVEKDGTVKAQGQKVNRVLVDGKEFFGNDPKIATRNLPSDAVEKVQVYDKLSDAAQLTGFDDGNSEKTINLKLKKDKKKGLFGKAMAGAGTDDRYQGKFNVNSFKGARQMSAIGMGNNTNAEGFSFMDLLNFSGELNRMRQSGGGGNINITVSDDNAMAGAGGNNNGTGINTTWGGGFNYNNIIGNNTDFTSNYFYNRYNPQRETHIERQYFLPDSTYRYNQNSYSDNLNNSHRINLGADIKIDSFHSIKISPSFGLQNTRNTINSDYRTFSEQGQTSNEGFSNSNSESQGYNFRNDLLFRKKFRLKGRTFSLNLQTSLNASEGTGSLESINQFYTKTGAPIKTGTDSIHQRNDNSSDLFSYNVRGVYTEPIFKGGLMELSLGKSNSRSQSDKTTYDLNKSTGKYDQVNDRLSNDFENTYGYINGGLRLRMQKKKFNVAVGLNWQEAELEGKITSGVKDSVMTKKFNNLLPNARVQYNFTKYRNMTLTYNTITNQPTISQLQPIPDISDPLNIKEGNPDLQQEYAHAVQLIFTSVNPFKNKNLFAFITASKTQNKIVNYDIIDALGIKTTKPVNVDGVVNVNGNISLGLPVRFLKGTINLSSGIGYNKGKQFINTVANDINTLNLGPELRLDMNLTEQFFTSAGAEFTYYSTKYSLQPALNTKYLTQRYFTDINWQLPKSFFLSTEFSYTINSQRATGFNANVPLWNASISKQFLNYNRGELKLTAFDLLNQNVGISRTTNQNYIEDKRVTNLQRYFLLSFTYSLSKNGLGSGRAQGGNIRIMR